MVTITPTTAPGAVVHRARRWLFTARASSPIWLIPRLWLGILWLQSLSKLFGESRHSWLAGDTVRMVTDGSVDQHWYYSPIIGPIVEFVGQHAVATAWVVAIIEIAIGIGVLTGTHLRVAAAVGVLVPLAYGLAGIGGQNIEFMVVAALLFAAAPVAGLIGGDGLIQAIRNRPAGHGHATAGEFDVVPA